MLRALRPAVVACALLAVPSAGAAALQERLDDRSNEIAYAIRARVDGETKRLAGEETITWTNRSGEATSELWFHLYLNAFASTRSRHLVEADGRLRGVEVKEGWGWQRVTSIRVGGEELVGTLAWMHPDEPEGVESEDRTVFKVDLPAPVADGETIEIAVTWESQLPRVRRRTGYKEDFLYVAQWYPKLGVLEGGRGWNAHQFHANSEFYADYGTYDVTLDLPAEYAGKIAATGVRVSETVSEGRVAARFLAPSEPTRSAPDFTGRLPRVHDFAWTADPDYEVVEGTFSVEEWKQRYPLEVERAQRALGADRDLGLRTVKVICMIQPERVDQAERHIEATCVALFFYGLWFGGYPYEQLVVVDPAWGGRAAGGMEYPMIFTAGTRLFTTPDMYQPESVTVHEAGHQFWYGLVGNNEFEAAWLDEGLNSFSDSEALWRHYGWNRRTTTFAGLHLDGERPTSAPGGGRLGDWLTGRRWDLPWTDVELSPLPGSDLLDLWREQPLLTLEPARADPRWSDRAGYLRDPDTDPIDAYAWLYADRLSYRTNSYPRPAVALRSLIGVIGFDAFLSGMRHYAEAWRYRHPYPDDFFASFIEGAGVDVQWYFDDLFRSTKTVDWQVEVAQGERKPAKGMRQEGVNGPWVAIPEPEDAGDDADGTAAADEVPAAAAATPGAVEPGDGDATAAANGAGGDAAASGDSGEGVADGSEDAQGAGAAGAGEPEDGALARSEKPGPPGAPPAGPEGAEEPAAPAATPETASVEETAAGEVWDIDVVVRRKGELCLPLRILLSYADGTAEEVVWTRADQAERAWLRIRREKDVKLESVVLDPERLYYLDRDMSDNQWYAETDAVAPLRWAERVLTQYAHLLHWQSGIGG